MKEKTGGYQVLFRILIILLLFAYLFTGLKIFRDYGATPDERNQIEAGHITWTAICEHFGKSAPQFDNLPKLENYYNRYYGQAATFPTVLIETLKGFSMHNSTIIRMRHLWNFLLFFAGTLCLGALIWLRHRHEHTVFFLLLLYILTPRLFGDAFYNDRDALLVSLFWISLLCFEWFRRAPGILPAVCCGFFFALTINTRFFGLLLLFLPVLYLISRTSRKKGIALLIIPLTLIFWYLITPLFWGHFPGRFAEAFRMFATGQQRTQETGGMALVLFFGRYFPENDLPFYYLPVWIFISTPLVPQLLTVIGLGSAFFRKYKKRIDGSRFDITDIFMAAVLCFGTAAVMVLRPVLYNGWRHLLFFYVPVFWFAAAGLDQLLNAKRKAFVWAAGLLVLGSACFTALRIRSLHPYEYIYLNPLFQAREGEFDRDYWRLSTTECLEWIGKAEEEDFSIGEYNGSIDNTAAGLLPGLIDRMHIRMYSALHRYPADYLIINYSGETGNRVTVPLYEPVYVAERDGIKLGEVVHRIPAVMPVITQIDPDKREATDQIPETEWRSEDPQGPDTVLTMEFEDMTVLRGLSLLPGDDEREYARSPEVSVSVDGENWTILRLTVTGLFDLSFPETETKWLRIRNTEPADVRWSIREIYFY